MNKRIFTKQAYSYILLVVVMMMNQAVFAGGNTTRGLEKIKDIPAQEVERGMGYKFIDLSEYFSCGEGEEIGYALENSDTLAVQTIIRGDRLRLCAFSEEEKSANITVTASVGEEELSSSFVVTVKEAEPHLRLLEPISDQKLRMNGNRIQLNMFQYFASNSMFDITYDISIEGENLIEASIFNGMMDIISTKGNEGIATVSLTVTAGEQSLTEEFTVEVKDVATEIVQIKEFEDVEMKNGDEAYELDMTEYFTCNAAYDLSYNGYFWNTNVGHLSMEDGTIKVNVTMNQEGGSKVTIKALAGGDVLETEFQILVSKTDINLVKVKDIPAQSMQKNGEALTIDLSEYFTCSEEYTIIYVANMPEEAIATTSIEENTLTIAGVEDKTGVMNITVEARVGVHKVESTFELTIEDTEGVDNVEVGKLSVYPNPVNDYYIVDSSEAGTVEVYTNQGILVNTYDVNKHSNRIEVGDLVTGIYFVKLTSGDSISVGKMFVK